MADLGINVFGFINGEFGIAEATRLNCKAMQRAGIPLNLMNYDVRTNHDNNDQTFTKFSDKADHPINLVQVSASVSEMSNFFEYFDYSFFERKYNILYMAWESETIPEDYLLNINLFDEVWTPSEYCKKCIEKYIASPVKVIPHPIDINLKPTEDSEALNFYNTDFFNFLFIFDYNSSIQRKNVLNLIKVFRETFDGKDNKAFLTIKTSKSDKFSLEKQQIKEAIGDSVKIKVVEKIFDKNALNYVISTCDSYISLHRSEGFGLTMAEAMYFGKPVIATGYSGNLQFMNAENSFLVNAEKVSYGSDDLNYDSNTIWSEPSLEEASIYLKKIYEGGDDVKAASDNARKTITSDFSLEGVGKLIRERSEELISEGKILQSRSALMKLYADNIFLKKDLRIYKKSKPIQWIYDIKMYFRNRKGKK
ncbi:glycosyltransferase involved in cell wall biosynthesis [Chryseobacterium sediminis]|uniref:Glycosyltransferase involved in cell wall biosynthesis n=1 Tax=Chryseobacterium sediminis TaxID=1679494 RepID=A0ABR6Q2G2_9FLAO|nr:glycosyltransferase [Chryseobacterium sediminis]MBB6332004.1 glycosyltransferase involved in cell wall biosynthesis [Chryseobacterium sediminis]